jgi:uncharacterized cofD-like protein
VEKATKKKIVVLGGGTGTSTVLRGLREHDVKLTAIVSMADDGGSTGMLRTELGILPPGDIRQCLLALSNADDEVKNLFAYRFSEGGLKGHNAGNLILAALEKSTGSFEEAIAAVKKILKVKGDVLPVTLDHTTLHVIHGEDKAEVVGEHLIDEVASLGQPRSFFLEPRATISKSAKKAIRGADAIVIGPGSLSTSLIPVLIVDGVKEAIAKSGAKIIYNVNLVPTPGQTEGYSVADYARDIELYLPRPIDCVIYDESAFPGTQIANGLSANLRSDTLAAKQAGDMIARSAVRHNSAALAKVIADYLHVV